MSETLHSAKSTVGLKNLVIAILSEDSESALTYDTIQKVIGAIDATITPGNAEANIQYADDVEMDVIYPDPEITVAFTLTDLPLPIQAQILGAKIDDNGVLVRSAGDKPPYIAIGFKAEKTDGTFRYVWILKARAKPITESYKTKEGATIERQTGKVEFTAIKRTHDGQHQYVADEGVNGFDAAKAATFLSTVYEAEFTAS